MNWAKLFIPKVIHPDGSCSYCAVVVQDLMSLKRRQGIGDIRRVQLHKCPDEGLGMSITVSPQTCTFKNYFN